MRVLLIWLQYMILLTYSTARASSLFLFEERDILFDSSVLLKRLRSYSKIELITNEGSTVNKSMRFVNFIRVIYTRGKLYFVHIFKGTEVEYNLRMKTVLVIENFPVVINESVGNQS